MIGRHTLTDGRSAAGAFDDWRRCIDEHDTVPDQRRSTGRSGQTPEVGR